jgi:hypothetical protein
METFNISEFTNNFSEYLNTLEGTVDWTDKRLAKITRLRLLSDPGFPFWDVSYCYGQLRDGTNVHVDLPFSQLPKRDMKAWIIKYAKKDGVYAKGLGIFDNISRFC